MPNTPNNPDLAGGNEQLPYWDIYIDRVVEPDGLGGYQLKTSGGGGGGGNSPSVLLVQPMNVSLVNGNPLIASYSVTAGVLTVEYFNAVTGASTTLPAGTTSVLAISTLRPIQQFLVDATNTQFIRTYYYNNDGDIGFTRDRALDGTTPYAPTLPLKPSTGTNATQESINSYAAITYGTLRERNVCMTVSFMNLAPSGNANTSIGQCVLGAFITSTGVNLDAAQMGILTGGVNAGVILPSEVAHQVLRANTNTSHYGLMTRNELNGVGVRNIINPDAVNAVTFVLGQFQ